MWIIQFFAKPNYLALLLCRQSPSGDAVEKYCLRIVIWLILPVVICLSQRLSHACLSISVIQRNCEWLIKTVIVYLIVTITRIPVAILELIRAHKPDFMEGLYLLDSNHLVTRWRFWMNHGKRTNRMLRAAMNQSSF